MKVLALSDQIVERMYALVASHHFDDDTQLNQIITS